MDFTTIFIIGGVVLLAILVLIARLAVRWIVRMTIVGVILLALIGGGLFWWWTNRLTSKPQQNRQPAQPTRRASSH
ncbi:MAG: hypothetical protein H0V18_00235 [Pyrinomonadaceae bacterium]|jgi:protein-S-isoprenylcysteine O-methyltransferase Ste14|nr:hypothetical protein [Pyrinomonadaceae bacterium]